MEAVIACPPWIDGPMLQKPEAQAKAASGPSLALQAYGDQDDALPRRFFHPQPADIAAIEIMARTAEPGSGTD